MLTYITRRLATAALILLGASFVVYLLTAASGDPLREFRESNAPNKEQLMQQRRELLDLDTPAPLRYFGWLGGAARCLVPILGGCDLGRNLQGQPVTEALGQAMGQTLLLVTGAALLAIIIGVGLGVITALRQYSTLDYGVTFLAFLFFSLPIFWLAVLLKEWGAIGFNNFLRDPVIPPAALALFGLAGGLICAVAATGSLRRRAAVFAVGFFAAAGTAWYLSLTGWFRTPGLGPVVLLLSGAGIAAAVTFLSTGLRNRKVLRASMLASAASASGYFFLQPLFSQATLLMMALLAVGALLVGAAAGYLAGGPDRAAGMRAAALSALLTFGLVVLDRFMQAWPAYLANSRVRGRPIATIGSATPNLDADFWLTGIDTFTHLVLPTTALVLASLAGYSRYSRASMLEIMNMDYIRTARAKGLPERAVVMRHAFRNALIPLATIVAFDIGGLIGGAVITENVFSFSGMGQLFIDSLYRVDPNPVMGVFLAVGVTALLFNLAADLVYSALDPRIRVKA